MRYRPGPRQPGPARHLHRRRLCRRRRPVTGLTGWKAPPGGGSRRTELRAVADPNHRAAVTRRDLRANANRRYVRRYRTGGGSSSHCRTRMFCAAPPGHLVVPTGETAVLPWMHDRMGQAAARAAAARHSAGLGARLPVRRVRTRVPAFRVRTGIARAAEASRSAGAPQAGCRHPRPAGTGGAPV